MSIQWYPGHMAKAKREVAQHLKLVDITVELVDARIPASSRNPDIDELLAGKDRVVALNKADLAQPGLTKEWVEWFRKQGLVAVTLNAREGAGARELTSIVISTASGKLSARESKGRGTRPVRAMVVGIPNVGKSSLINRMAGRSGAKTGDRPGVTRGQQWIRVNTELELLDTPGVLWPKFADPEVGYRLAITGAIDDRLFSAEAVALRLLAWLAREMPEQLAARYGLADVETATPEGLLDGIGRKRGCLLAGGVVDLERAGATIIGELRSGRLGPVTLEAPPKAASGPGTGEDSP